MRAAATSIDALQKSAAATQNNVTNASTPGYAAQKVRLRALEMQVEGGLAGGVKTSRLFSTRDEFAEKAVRLQTSNLAAAKETATQMALLEGSFAIDNSAGITGNLDKLFKQFSSWSVAPQSLSEKQNVLSAATDVANAFNRTAGAIQLSGQNAETNIQTTLNAISDIAERIRQHNVDIRNGGASDAGVDAGMHSDLEELSHYVEIQAVFQSDGTATVLIGRQTQLVTGDQKFGFSLSPDPTPPPPALAGATPKMQILDKDGNDVTATMAGGEIGSLLDFRNNTITSFVGSAAGPGDLNRMAKKFADRVNFLLTAGDVPPVPMFQYSNDISAAASLKVNPAITAANLSASDPTTTPATGNGRALSLAALAHPGQAADQVDGLSYVSFFGRISANAGRLSSEANLAVVSHQQILAQAQTVRQSISGVSLDEEAVNLIQVQRAYQASSRMMAVLDELTQLAVNLGRN